MSYIRDYFAFHGLSDHRWGGRRASTPTWSASTSSGGRSAPRARRVQRVDLPAARNPDGSLKAQPVANRTPAERRTIEAALDYIRSFEAR